MTLTELLDDCGVDYREHGDHHHVSAGWVGLDCPDCSPGSHRFRLGVNTRTMAASCYVCGKVNLGEALAGVTSRPIKECWGLLGKVERVEGPRKTPGNLVLPTRVGPMLPAHVRYLKGRKFDPDEIAAVWGVGGTGGDSNYPWRLFIPITRDGEVVSWTTRELHDRGKRYHSAGASEEKVSHKTLLYGEENCVNAVIVHEGATDAWRTGPGAVATMGLTVTASQVRRIALYPRRVICFDNSPDAQRRASRLAEQVSVYPGETLVVCLNAADPGSAGVSEIKKLRRLLR